jgi:hypothetical protein
MKRKKKRKIFSLSAFGPAVHRSLPPVSQARGPFPSSPLPRLGRAQQALAAWLARARVALSFPYLPSLTPRVHVSGAPLTQADAIVAFLIHHRSNPPLISFLSLFRASLGYKNGMSHPLRSIFHRNGRPTSSRGGYAGAAALAAASPSRATPLVRLRLRFCPK